jgi:L-seryl-tRNA(Ser) seleniumtransferase
MADFRLIPSIDRLRQRPIVLALETRFGRRATLEALRNATERVRETMAAGTLYADIAASIEHGARLKLEEEAAFSLRPVINATGVIIHTNLGRAPLSAAAAARVGEIASGYCNLEYDVERGIRGQRDAHAERLICGMTGAAAACVVNNNAAATLITLAALAAGREVIVSRGELVEIGGGFRVPDVMAQSGAVLREVGTTNRTRVSDYAAAISDRTALILRVHPSNFRIEGFTERPSVQDLATLAARFDLPVVDDLGSGYIGESNLALDDEPEVSATLRQGARVVMFSGDKLLGGPQAGIIAGDAGLVAIIRRHPLMRAVRVDKMTYAALEATLQAYASDRRSDVPVSRMIDASLDEIGDRALRLAERLALADFEAEVVDGASTIGGGSAPGTTIPTRLVRLEHPTLSANELEGRLRATDPPVIARIDEDRVVVDLRTVAPADDPLLAELIELAGQAVAPPSDRQPA